MHSQCASLVKFINGAISPGLQRDSAGIYPYQLGKILHHIHGYFTRDCGPIISTRNQLIVVSAIVTFAGTNPCFIVVHCTKHVARLWLNNRHLTRCSVQYVSQHLGTVFKLSFRCPTQAAYKNIQIHEFVNTKSKKRIIKNMRSRFTDGRLT